MSGTNVAEWTPDQVAEWLTGVDPVAAQYCELLRAAEVGGKRLLLLTGGELESLGVKPIGHQEIILDAIELLRDFVYETGGECLCSASARLAACARGCVRSLASLPPRAALPTQALADVANTLNKLKTLICWIDRVCGGGGGGSTLRGVWGVRGAALGAALSAAACAQRDRFADSPAGKVRAALSALAQHAEHLLRDVPDARLLSGARVLSASWVQGNRPLGFSVGRALCGHVAVTSVRFGSPAHASNRLHAHDEVVGVGSRCVVGWAPSSVLAAAAATPRELSLRLRRRAAPPAPPPPRLRALAPPPVGGVVVEPEGAQSSSDSEPLSPPASPLQHAPYSRLVWPRGRTVATRRHSVCGGSPRASRHTTPLDQWWRELRPEKADDEDPLYRRDKAVSCSTGLERSPRPATCSGVSPSAGSVPAPAAVTRTVERGRLDKSHSTPAYADDQENEPPPPPPRRPEPTPAPRVPPPTVAPPPVPLSPPSPGRPLTKRDIVMLSSQRREMPPINSEAESPPADANTTSRKRNGSNTRVNPPPATTTAVRSMFTRSLKKKNSLIAKGRLVSMSEACARAAGAGGCAGRVWQRVRGRAGRSRWARRLLLLAPPALLAYRPHQMLRACLCAMVCGGGWTAGAAGEVRSRAHAFKLYHACGRAAYFAADSPADAARWIHALQQAANMQHSQVEITKQFSETEYSETESEPETESSVATLVVGGSTSDVAGSGTGSGGRSLDRKYLRFFSRDKHDKVKAPTEQRRTSGRSSAAHASSPDIPAAERAPSAPTTPIVPMPPSHKHKGVGVGSAGGALLTLEQLMLSEQRLQGHAHTHSNTHTQPVRAVNTHRALQRQLERIVPDVIYGELPPQTPPSSNTDKDGYEKIVYPEESTASRRVTPSALRRHNKIHAPPPQTAPPPPPPRAPTHRDTTGGDVRALRLLFSTPTTTPPQPSGALYPHLQCPPTFQPETYSLTQPRHTDL